MASKTQRVEARVSPEERGRIQRAAQLSGESVSAFMVAAAIEKAEQVIADVAVTTVPADYFDRLSAALDEADRAPGLAQAAWRARERSRIG